MIKHENFEIYVTEDYDSMSKKTADIIANQINQKNDSVIGLATGASPEGTYKELIDKKLDFSGITTFNLDEYVGLSPSDKQSYAYYMNQHLFDHVNIHKQNINIPSGVATDADLECKDYEQKIEKAGGIDLILIGIGLNGHIGFSEPAPIFYSKTHKTQLAPKTIEANKKYFESEEAMPKYAITMGIGTVMHARHILLIASGEKKADILHGSMFGDIDPQVPASALQMHQKVTIVADKEAASKIMKRLGK